MIMKNSLIYLYKIKCSYFIEKTQDNIQKIDNNNNKIQNINLEQEVVKANPYNESEGSREDDLPVNENLFTERNSIIKGISLAFVFFSVIIYSLLYMLAPEKSANLIFEGNYNSTLFNSSLCKIGVMDNIFYKLDTINIRDNCVVMNVSLNCISTIAEQNKLNYLVIKIIFFKDEKIINNILVTNNFISKEINDISETYNDFKINDFPFWLCLYNKDDKGNNYIRNITSDYLINFLK